MALKRMEYTELKKYLDIEGDKQFTNDHAYLTHYLQNSDNGVAELYKERALQFIASKIENSKKKNWEIPFPPTSKPKFKFIDLFAGIGGFRLALQNLGGKSVFSSELDNAAKRTYEANFGEYPFGDIRDFTKSEIDDDELNNLIPSHNILAAGFPCQPFSLAGVSARNSLGLAHGFSDLDKGNLFFDIARIIDVKRPDAVFLENVKNFKTHDKGRTFEVVKNTIEELGYSFYWDTINASKWVPQKRQRFYMVCFRNDLGQFNFPISDKKELLLKNILEKKVSSEYTISDKLWIGHQNRTKRNLERGTGFTAHLADINKPANTLVARYGKDGKECLIPQNNKNPRKLTPRECARLQGFPESYILPSSNAAAYKQFGNSVAVPVIQAIAEEIVIVLKKNRSIR